MKEDIQPIIAVLPGEVLKRELKTRGIKQKDLAEVTGLQPSHLSELVKGTRSVNNQIADKLEKALGIPAIHWIKLQSDYDFASKQLEIMTVAEREAEIDYREYDKVFDVKTLMKRLGQSFYSIYHQILFCKQTLGLPAPAEMQVKYGHFHKSEKTGTDTRMILTWALLARYAAGSIKVKGAFSKDMIPEMTGKLAVVLNENNNTEKQVCDILSAYGIRFTIVPKVDKASIDGYSFFCEDGIPAIVVTKRLPRIDNYAFAILHEVGHLYKHQADSLPHIAIAGEDEDKIELEANEYAANALIPIELWRKAPEVSLNPVAIQEKFTRWSEENHLNKWIVLGRISHETGMYKFTSDETRNIQ